MGREIFDYFSKVPRRVGSLGTEGGGTSLKVVLSWKNIAWLVSGESLKISTSVSGVFAPAPDNVICRFKFE